MDITTSTILVILLFTAGFWLAWIQGTRKGFENGYFQALHDVEEMRKVSR